MGGKPTVFQVKVSCNFITFFKLFLAEHKNSCNEEESNYISIYCAMVNSL